MLVVLVAILATTAVAACGSSNATPAQKQEAKAEAAKFEARAKGCLPSKNGLPDLTSLRSSAGRKSFAACLVPPAQRSTFTSCSERAVIGKFNKIRIEQGLNACLVKVS